MAIINARIQMRRGNEADFDPDQMTPGEWAVSTDKKYVRMCFSPGVCIRMATYDAFEADMKQIMAILEEAKTIQEAINSIYDEFKDAQLDIEAAKNYSLISKSYAVGGTGGIREGEDVDNSKYYAEQAALSSASAIENANIATTKAADALASEKNAKTSENNASVSANTAIEKAGEAANSADSILGAVESSKENADNATLSAESAKDSEEQAKYYYEQAKSISESFSGALRPMGTVTFTNLPVVSSATAGDMYNISDQFTTTSDFKEGTGNVIPAGSNVYKTSDGYWDVLAGSPVTGIKGNSETSYRRGNVNITKNNIGLGNVPNVATNDQTPTFTQASARNNIVSGEKVSVLFGKIMKFFADLKAVAFSGSYNDLSNKPSIPSLTNNLLATNSGTALDAAQGKILDDKITEVNNSLSDLSKPIDIFRYGFGYFKAEDLSNVQYGGYRIDIPVEKSPSGIDTGGMLFNLPTLYDMTSTTKAVLQIFWGYQSNTLSYRVYWYGFYTQWLTLATK